MYRISFSLLFAAFACVALVVGCSSSSSPAPTSNDYQPLSVGTWWRYQTPTGIIKRTVEGTKTLLGSSYFAIRDSSTNALTYLRRDGTQYFTTYFNRLDEPLLEAMVIDESPGASWSADIRLDAQSILESYNVSPLIASRTVLGTSYSNVLQEHRVAFRSQSGIKDTILSDQYLAKGVGEIELVVNGVEAEQLLAYHFQ
jgi:hypothetical protein